MIAPLGARTKGITGFGFPHAEFIDTTPSSRPGSRIFVAEVAAGDRQRRDGRVVEDRAPNGLRDERNEIAQDTAREEGEVELATVRHTEQIVDESAQRRDLP